MLDLPWGPAFVTSQCQSNHPTSPANFCLVPGDDEVFQPTPHHPAPHSSQVEPSSSSQTSSPDCTGL